MNTIINNMPITIAANPAIVKKLAVQFGIKESTVKNYLCGRKSTSSRPEVLAAARELGYMSRTDLRKMENTSMLNLREKGWSNADIAKRFGVSYQTILHRLGKQPEGMTKMNISYGQRMRAMKNAHRRQVAADEIIRLHNKKVEAMEKAKMQVKELEKEIKDIRPLAAKAAKVSAIKMIVKQENFTAIQ